MEQIRLDLEGSLDVSVYTNPELEYFQMDEVRKGLFSERECGYSKDRANA